MNVENFLSQYFVQHNEKKKLSQMFRFNYANMTFPQLLDAREYEGIAKKCEEIWCRNPRYLIIKLDFFLTLCLPGDAGVLELQYSSFNSAATF